MVPKISSVTFIYLSSSPDQTTNRKSRNPEYFWWKRMPDVKVNKKYFRAKKIRIPRIRIWWPNFFLWNFPIDFVACMQKWLIFKMRFLIIDHFACFASFKFRISSIKSCKHLTPAGQCFKISEPSFLSFDNFNVLHILSISKLWSFVNKYYEVNKCLLDSTIFCFYSSAPAISRKKNVGQTSVSGAFMKLKTLARRNLPSKAN